MCVLMIVLDIFHIFSILHIKINKVAKMVHGNWSENHCKQLVLTSSNTRAVLTN